MSGRINKSSSSPDLGLNPFKMDTTYDLDREDKQKETRASNIEVSLENELLCISYATLQSLCKAATAQRPDDILKEILPKLLEMRELMIAGKKSLPSEKKASLRQYANEVLTFDKDAKDQAFFQLKIKNFSVPGLATTSFFVEIGTEPDEEENITRLKMKFYDATNNKSLFTLLLHKDVRAGQTKGTKTDIADKIEPSARAMAKNFMHGNSRRFNWERGYDKVEKFQLIVNEIESEGDEEESQSQAHQELDEQSIHHDRDSEHNQRVDQNSEHKQAAESSSSSSSSSSLSLTEGPLFKVQDYIPKRSSRSSGKGGFLELPYTRKNRPKRQSETKKEGQEKRQKRKAKTETDQSAEFEANAETEVFSLSGIAIPIPALPATSSSSSSSSADSDLSDASSSKRDEDGDETLDQASASIAIPLPILSSENLPAEMAASSSSSSSSFAGRGLLGMNEPTHPIKQPRAKQQKSKLLQVRQMEFLTKLFEAYYYIDPAEPNAFQEAMLRFRQCKTYVKNDKPHSRFKEAPLFHDSEVWITVEGTQGERDIKIKIDGLNKIHFYDKDEKLLFTLEMKDKKHKNEQTPQWIITMADNPSSLSDKDVIELCDQFYGRFADVDVNYVDQENNPIANLNSKKNTGFLARIRMGLLKNAPIKKNECEFEFEYKGKVFPARFHFCTGFKSWFMEEQEEYKTYDKSIAPVQGCFQLLIFGEKPKKPTHELKSQDPNVLIEIIFDYRKKKFEIHNIHAKAGVIRGNDIIKAIEYINIHFLKMHDFSLCDKANIEGLYLKVFDLLVDQDDVHQALNQNPLSAPTSTAEAPKPKDTEEKSKDEPKTWYQTQEEFESLELIPGMLKTAHDGIIEQNPKKRLKAINSLKEMSLQQFHQELETEAKKIDPKKHENAKLNLIDEILDNDQLKMLIPGEYWKTDRILDIFENKELRTNFEEDSAAKKDTDEASSKDEISKRRPKRSNTSIVTGMANAAYKNYLARYKNLKKNEKVLKKSNTLLQLQQSFFPAPKTVGKLATLVKIESEIARRSKTQPVFESKNQSKESQSKLTPNMQKMRDVLKEPEKFPQQGPLSQQCLYTLTAESRFFQGKMKRLGEPPTQPTLGLGLSSSSSSSLL